jgi:hypothetical protein
VNKVVRKIFGPRKEQERGGWRNMHNEEIHDIYSSPNIIRMVKMENYEICGACSTHGIEDKLIRIAGRKTWMMEITRKT